MTERQYANNAKGQLLAGISSIATTMLMKDSMENRFPTHNGSTDKDYYITLKKYDTDGVSWTKQEIVLVTARTGNAFTITRSAGSCPASSSATTQTTTAFSFDADDYIEMTDVAEIPKEIRSAINTLDSDKADDTAVVHNTGNETVAGVKTFSNSPIVPTPTTDYQVAPKKYVDDLLASVSATVSSATAGEDLTAGNALFVADGTEVLSEETETSYNAGTVDQGRGAYDDGGTVSSWGQTFTVGANTINVKKLKLDLVKQGAGAIVNIGIKAVDGSSLPTGAFLSSVLYNGSALTTSFQTIEIEVDNIAVLSANTEYAITIEGQGGSGDSSNNVRGNYASPGGYADGHGLEYTGTRADYAGRDFGFEIIDTDYATEGNVYKTSANDVKRLGFIGFAKTNVNAGNSVNIDNAGVSALFSALDTTKTYFLNDTQEEDIILNISYNNSNKETGNYQYFQGFTATKKYISTVKCHIAKHYTSSGSDNVTAYIYSLSGGLPDTLIKSGPTVVVDYDGDSDLQTEYEFDFNPQELDTQLAIGTDYCIVFSASSDSVQLAIAYDVANLNNYTNGYKYNSSSSWTVRTTDYNINISGFDDFIGCGNINTTPGTYTKEVGLAVSATQLLIKNLSRKAKGTSAGSGTVTVGFYPVLVIYTSTDNTSAYFDEAGISNKTQTGFDIDGAYDRVAFG